MIETAAFLASLEAQRVLVAPRIERALNTGKSGVPWSEEPTPILAGFAALGLAMRIDHGQQIVSGPYQADLQLTADPAASAFSRALVSAGQPSSYPVDTPSNSFKGTKIVVNVCRQAEQRFAEVMIQSYVRHGGVSDPFSSQIVVDEGNRPLFVRKKFGEGSSLALQTFEVDGIEFPAGSLACVVTGDDIVLGNYLEKPVMANDLISVIPSSNVMGVSAMRLSSYVYPSKERTILFEAALQTLPATRHRPAVSKGAREFAAEATLDYIRELAQGMIGW